MPPPAAGLMGSGTQFWVERLFRDVRATEIYQGTSEAQRMIIAANVLSQA